MDAKKELSRGDRLMSFDIEKFAKGEHAMPIFTESMRNIGMTREEFESDLNRFKSVALEKRMSKNTRKALAIGGLFTMGATYVYSANHDCHAPMKAARKEMDQRNKELFSQYKPWQWRIEFVQGMPNMYEGSLFYSPLD